MFIFRCPTKLLKNIISSNNGQETEYYAANFAILVQFSTKICRIQLVLDLFLSLLLHVDAQEIGLHEGNLRYML